MNELMSKYLLDSDSQQNMTVTPERKRETERAERDGGSHTLIDSSTGIQMVVSRSELNRVSRRDRFP